MNKIITQSVKVALTAGALAAALTGCCMFGSKDCCCGKNNCCKSECDGLKNGEKLYYVLEGDTLKPISAEEAFAK